mgnify:CR=1 FL=1
MAENYTVGEGYYVTPRAIVQGEFIEFMEHIPPSDETSMLVKHNTIAMFFRPHHRCEYERVEDSRMVVTSKSAAKALYEKVYREELLRIGKAVKELQKEKKRLIPPSEMKIN